MIKECRNLSKQERVLINHLKFYKIYDKKQLFPP